MKLYVVFGVEYHISRDLLGVYDDLKLAEERRKRARRETGYDEIIINEIELNEDME
ncbi:MAG: hypothetical protein WC886_06885 [Saccharofermentanaceae bacterium]|jgi:hypothetical protein